MAVTNDAAMTHFDHTSRHPKTTNNFNGLDHIHDADDGDDAENLTFMEDEDDLD
jgi:hypothetical protein